MLMIILCAVASIAFFYYCIHKPMNSWRVRGVAQGKPWLVFGHTIGTWFHTQSWKDIIQTLYYQSPGTRYTGMYHLHYPLLVIKDIDLIKQVTVKDFDHFTDHISFLPADSDSLFGKNLFSLQGKQWREMRSLLSPSFTGSKMRFMFTLMLESAENFVNHFLKGKEDTVIIEMKDTFSRFTSDIIATAACGIKVDSLAEPENEFFMMGQAAIDFSNTWKNIKFALYKMIPSIKKVLKIQLFSDEVSDFFRGIIDETIKVREEQGIVRPDMIHLLLEARKELEKQIKNDTTGQEKLIKTLTNEDITAQALVFFIAGFDSVSSLMCFASYELAINKDIQDTLREEVQLVWKECGGKLTYEALLQMKYMDMVISETLRKWPINIAVDRICTKAYTIEPVLPGEKPIHLKEGDYVWLPAYSIHNDPEHYPDPERFDPERFSDGNKGNIKPYSFLPFGLGPRNCIGSRFALMETKIIIFYILLHFELVPIEKTTIPIEISKKSFALNVEGGMWLGMRKIKINTN